MSGRFVASGVLPGNAISFPIGRVAAAVDRNDRWRDPVLQFFDHETIGAFFLSRFHGRTFLKWPFKINHTLPGHGSLRYTLASGGKFATRIVR